MRRDKKLLVYERRLSLFNEVAAPFRRYAADYLRAKSLTGTVARRLSPSLARLVEIDFDPRSRSPVARISLFLSNLDPKLNDFHLVLYVSGQRTRKRPYQSTSIARALLSASKKLRGEVVHGFVAEKGATRGAYAYLRKTGILVARRARDLLGLVARFFEKRWQRLRAALAGKRIWGPVALLALILAEIARYLGLQLVRVDEAVELAEAVANNTQVLIDPGNGGTG